MTRRRLDEALKAASAVLHYKSLLFALIFLDEISRFSFLDDVVKKPVNGFAAAAKSIVCGKFKTVGKRGRGTLL